MPRGELDHLDAARDLAFGIGERLAVLLRDDAREVLALRIHEVAEAHHDARAALPSWRVTPSLPARILTSRFRDLMETH